MLIHFPETKGSTAADADAFLTKRGLILRAVGAYKLPNALRMTVGTEEANRLVVEGARRVHGEAGVSERPIFNRLALIGVGLIGSSIARAARAQGAVRSIVATARSPQTRKRVAELGIADQVVETNAAAVEGADLVIVCIPVGACGAVAKEIGPHLRSRRDRLRRRLGQGRGACATWPRICRQTCISSRRIRSPAPNIPARTPALPNCSSTAGAS